MAYTVDQMLRDSEESRCRLVMSTDGDIKVYEVPKWDKIK